MGDKKFVSRNVTPALFYSCHKAFQRFDNISSWLFAYRALKERKREGGVTYEVKNVKDRNHREEEREREKVQKK